MKRRSSTTSSSSTTTTTLYFATSNKNKFREASRILSAYGLEVHMGRVELFEIQSDDLTTIASEKARNAYTSLRRDVIVEDDGFFIHSLRGFPGPYSAFVYGTIGNGGILKLMDGVGDRRSAFISMIAYCDGCMTQTFVGKVDGRVSETKRGTSWGYDPIFVPDSYDLTYAELGSRKNEVSHRRLSLEKFARWYMQKSRSGIRGGDG